MHNISDPRPNFNMAPPSPSADPYHQGNIRMTLENSDLWKSFSDIGTEMIITKHGRRMFPHCNISLSGLQPEAKYVIMAEMIPVDNFRYKWNKEKWEVAGKAEPQPPCRTYLHPDSPAPGKHWMTQPISLPKLKLTNNTLDQHGYIILHSMQRYYPRFHVVQAETLYSVRWGHFHTFSFSETSFTAVTAYQNTKITKLKIDHNPFAKGFRKEGSHTRIKRHRPGKSPGKVAKKSKRDVDTEFQNPPELQRVPYDPQSTEGRLGAPDEVSAKEDLFSPWAVEQDPSQGLHTELHGQDCSSEEQMVPASMAYQPYRSVEYGRLLSPSSAAEDCGGRRSYESHGPDVATVPGGHEASRPGPAREMGHHHRPLAPPAMPPQDYRLTPNTMPMTSKSSPGLLAYPPLYGHYAADQGVGQWGGEGGAGQYLGPSPALPHHPHLLAADHGAPQRSYAAPTNTHHQGNTAEWSQYPLFSYSCW